jgi:hypothetical protein
MGEGWGSGLTHSSTDSSSVAAWQRGRDRSTCSDVRDAAAPQPPLCCASLSLLVRVCVGLQATWLSAPPHPSMASHARATSVT